MPYICQKGNDRDNQSDRRRETIEEFMIDHYRFKWDNIIKAFSNLPGTLWVYD